jgi:hypothetical protein
MSSDLFNDVHQHYLDLGFTEPDATPRLLGPLTASQRLAFMKEELDEYADALLADDIDGQVDALIDEVVVILGTLSLMGMGRAFPACWDEVLRANRAKVPGVGKRGMAQDLIKPDGWTPPDHLTILRRHGYVK